MVNKPFFKELDREPPLIDEAWWAALLAEEEKMPASVNTANPETETESALQSNNINWDYVKEIYKQDETIDLRVNNYNRGGLLVEGEAVQGFVPLSHLLDIPAEYPEKEREQLLANYVGKSLLLKVIECNPDRGRVVFSERAALAEPGKRNLLLNSLKSTSRVWGTVTNITDFGVFVDLGGLEGLIHVSELSWGRVRHPSDVVQLGEKIEVYVISVDEERSRVALSLKRLHSNPWKTVESRYHPGEVTEAVITSILPFGAFARLEEGLDGLIHVSEMGDFGETIKPTSILREGQKIRVRILQVDAARQRLGLSMRLST